MGWLNINPNESSFREAGHRTPMGLVEDEPERQLLKEGWT